MTDLPTRLRSDAQSVDRLGRVLSATGDDLEGPRLRERAGLMRAAADEIERLRGSFTCAARRQGSSGGNDPPECDWPVCGCDPHADKVIAALQESGLLPSPASSPIVKTGEGE